MSNNNTNNTTTLAGSDATKNPTDGDATPQKPAAQLEEDDEFEDFPVEDWGDEETEAQAGGEGNTHLWEESWDDDDTTEDFAKMLREEIKKGDQVKR